jgi:hypothetical protein
MARFRAEKNLPFEICIGRVMADSWQWLENASRIRTAGRIFLPLLCGCDVPRAELVVLPDCACSILVDSPIGRLATWGAWPNVLLGNFYYQKLGIPKGTPAAGLPND